jgi:hypothetical protein
VTGGNRDIIQEKGWFAMKRISFGVLILVVAGMAIAAAPSGWFLAGSKPANYDSGIDQYAAYSGLPSAYLKAKADEDGFGTLMQSVAAGRYLGKRIRLSGYVRSENVGRWAGLWVRVDGPATSPGAPPAPLAFDNMQNRAIKGTTAWQRYQVVLDVPDSATGISFGVLLDGPGEIWLNGSEFEVVTAAVPTTGNGGQAGQPSGPQNLSFTR